MQKQLTPFGEKARFSVSIALSRIRKAVAVFPKAAMFQLADDGHDSVFEQLIACILSIRTLDEISLSTAKKLFAAARTPAQIARLSVEEIDGLIQRSSSKA